MVLIFLFLLLNSPSEACLEPCRRTGSFQKWLDRQPLFENIDDRRFKDETEKVDISAVPWLMPVPKARTKDWGDFSREPSTPAITKK